MCAVLRLYFLVWFNTQNFNLDKVQEAMTRSVRDLRELINVSRLSYRDDDERDELRCDYSSDSDQDLTEVPREVSKPELPMRKNKDLTPLREKEKPTSPPLSSGSSGRGSPLPPISTLPNPSMSPVTSGRTSPVNHSLESRNLHRKKHVKPNFDSVLLYMDFTVVGEWLTKANSAIENLTSWLHYSDNFIQFAHFWLSEIPSQKQRELVEMEYSILMEEICFAFGAGLQVASISRQDVNEYISAVFWEYPQKFLGSRSKYFFLNILVCLCSGKKNNYRALLSDVQCSTSNKQVVQLILATRAFSIVNMCSGVLEFYKKMSKRNNFQEVTKNSLFSLGDFAREFVFQAIKMDLPDVLDYLVKSFSVRPHILKDRGGKSLIFAAVLSGKENMLHHLLKMDPRLDVNEKAPSGNTPLHTAVNTGNVTIVKLLIDSGANINAWNPECDGATPLHLAIMSGSTEIVSALLGAGCDTTVKMGIPATVTPINLAEDLGLDEIVDLLSTSTLS